MMSIRSGIEAFRNSLAFDIRQSANLYFMPVRALIELYQRGLRQLQHNPEADTSKFSQALTQTALHINQSEWFVSVTATVPGGQSTMLSVHALAPVLALSQPPQSKSTNPSVLPEVFQSPPTEHRAAA